MEGAKLIDKLLAEISKLDKKKTRLRPGIYYSWYPAAHAWDYNITKNREFAIQWRGQALELAKEGHLSSRQVRVVNKLGRRLGIRTAIFTVLRASKTIWHILV